MPSENLVNSLQDTENRSPSGELFFVSESLLLILLRPSRLSADDIKIYQAKGGASMKRFFDWLECGSLAADITTLAMLFVGGYIAVACLFCL